jgi:hypothetical protein
MQPWDDPEVRLQQRLIAQGREAPPELGLFGTIWTYAWAAAGVLVAAAIIFALLGSAVEFLRTVWTATKSDFLRALGGTMFVAVVSAGLFLIRRKQLVVYGLLEIAFGLASTARACTTVSAKPAADAFVLMAGCVYLIVRGLDNYFRGRTEVQVKTTST